MTKISKKEVSETKILERKRKADVRLAGSIGNDGVVSLVGELLKRQREFLNLSQKEISDKLNYKYMNFISMIENGACKIPLARIPDVSEAYGFAPEMMMALLKAIHPETWDVTVKITKANENTFKGISINEMHKQADKYLKDKLKEFRLPTDFD